MIVHAAESLYWFNTTEPPYLIKGFPTSLESRHTTGGGSNTVSPEWSRTNVLSFARINVISARIGPRPVGSTPMARVSVR